MKLNRTLALKKVILASIRFILNRMKNCMHLLFSRNLRISNPIDTKNLAKDLLPISRLCHFHRGS